MYSENSQRNQKVLANQNIGPFRTKRLFLIIMLFLLAVFPAEIGEYTRAALEDAYIGVSVFVALTLAFFYFAEKSSNDRQNKILGINRTGQHLWVATTGGLIKADIIIDAEGF